MFALVRRNIVTGEGASLATLRQCFLDSRLFDVRDGGSDLLLSRIRLVPNRGVLRLLIPRVVVRVSLADGQARYGIRLDWLAVLMTILLIGGVVTELTLDRARYPREYPPAFIYGLASVYVVLIAIELVRTRLAVERALGSALLSSALGNRRDSM